MNTSLEAGQLVIRYSLPRHSVCAHAHASSSQTLTPACVVPLGFLRTKQKSPSNTQLGTRTGKSAGALIAWTCARSIACPARTDHPLYRPELNRGPPMSRRIVHPTWGEDASADRFDVAPVGTAELDTERERGAKSCEDAHTAPTDVLQPDGKSVGMAGGVRERTAKRRRRVKAGHYPLGFSPYLMSANERGDVISLGRFVIKDDLKVIRPLHHSLRLKKIIVKEPAAGRLSAAIVAHRRAAHRKWAH